MGLLTTKQAIEVKFNTDWTFTDIAWPNVEFDPSSRSEWVRIAILPGTELQASAGGESNIYRAVGVVIIQIFVELNSGAKRALELADNASAIWRSLHLSNIRFKEPSVDIVGTTEGWYQVNVSCEYHTDELI